MTQTTNAVLRFALELVAFAALAAWGWHLGGGTPQRLALSIALPACAVLAWGRFVAPRAPRYLSRRGRLVVEACVFGSAAWALVDLGRPLLAAGVGLLAAANTLLVHAWGQDTSARAAATSRDLREPVGR